MTEKAVEAAAPALERVGSLRAIGWVVAAGSSVAALARFGAEPRAAVAVFFLCVLVAVSVVDIERRIIPNRIVLPATALVLAAQIALAPERALEWGAASLGAALFLLLPLLVYPAGMGLGDVKLALLLGAGLGWAVVPAFAVGFTAAGLVGIAMIVYGGLAARKTAIPFGPFLSLGAAVALFFSQGPHTG